MNEETHPHKRSVRNMLLQPSLQIRLGFVSILVAVFFSMLLGFLTWFSLRDFYAMVLELTERRQEKGICRLVSDLILLTLEEDLASMALLLDTDQSLLWAQQELTLDIDLLCRR